MQTNQNDHIEEIDSLLTALTNAKCLMNQQNCLGLIYTNYIEQVSVSLELVVAKLLLVRVPPPGSSLLRFSIGAGDKQAIQSPESDFLPVTSSSVSMLLRQLGKTEFSKIKKIKKLNFF